MIQTPEIKVLPAGAYPAYISDSFGKPDYHSPSGEYYPSTLVVSGVHGPEQLAVLASLDMFRTFKDRHESGNMHGHMQILAGVNPYGLIHGTREFMEEPDRNDYGLVPPAPGAPKKPERIHGDPKGNLNRAFRTQPNSVSCTLTGTIYDVKSHISHADIVIDIHNSPLCHNCVLIDNGPYAKAYVKFCHEQGLDFMVRNGPTDTIKRYAIEQGRVGFTIELGGMGDCPGQGDLLRKQTEFLHKLLDAISHIRKNCAITPNYYNGERKTCGGEYFWEYEDFFNQSTPFTTNAMCQEIYHYGKYGFIEYTSDATDIASRPVEAGTELGTIYCIDGTQEKIVAPIAGLVCDFKEHTNVAVPNKELYYIQPVEAALRELKNG